MPSTNADTHRDEFTVGVSLQQGLKLSSNAPHTATLTPFALTASFRSEDSQRSKS